jgi:NADH:ubiquinone oxidoreductase subunit 2 (subunit N)
VTQSGRREAKSETRVVKQKQLTKGKAALLLILSAVGAIVSAKALHGWHVYVGLAIVGVAIFIGFIRWNREN